MHHFNDFKQTQPYRLLNTHLNSEKHWWYRDVIEALIFAYYLKFGRLYLNMASVLIIRVISDHRYNTSRAYLNSILQHASSSEIVLMIEQATSPTFFLAEMEHVIKTLPLIPELGGTRGRYRQSIGEIDKVLREKLM